MEAVHLFLPYKQIGLKSYSSEDHRGNQLKWISRLDLQKEEILGVL